MATSAAASRLTEAHRLAQARLGADTVRQLLAVWRVLDPENLDESFPRWLRVVLPVVQGQRDRSARLAANYYTTFRTLELGQVAPVAPLIASAAPVEAVTTSMLVTGPASIRAALARGVSFERAVETAQARAAAAGMRHALNGGRDTIIRTAAADERAVGWVRTTSGNACAFCVMLASRGPVYSKRSVDFEAHDHCSCSSEPLFRRLTRDQWPASAQRAADLWAQHAKGLRTPEALSALRQAIQAGG